MRCEVDTFSNPPSYVLRHCPHIPLLLRCIDDDDDDSDGKKGCVSHIPCVAGSYLTIISVVSWQTMTPMLMRTKMKMRRRRKKMVRCPDPLLLISDTEPDMSLNLSPLVLSEDDGEMPTSALLGPIESDEEDAAQEFEPGDEQESDHDIQESEEEEENDEGKLF